MRYLIYCDESNESGRFYSNFYGGCILRAADREPIERELRAIKKEHDLRGELKWTKVSAYNESRYIAFVDKVFDFIEAGLLKIRIMFTQTLIKRMRSKNIRSGTNTFYYITNL